MILALPQNGCLPVSQTATNKDRVRGRVRLWDRFRGVRSLWSNTGFVGIEPID
jgi:hypothetical protein